MEILFKNESELSESIFLEYFRLFFAASLEDMFWWNAFCQVSVPLAEEAALNS